MRLSDAIALGRTLDKPWEKIGGPGSCAMQLAGLAANNSAQDWHTNLEYLKDGEFEIPCKCEDSTVGGEKGWIFGSRKLPMRRAVIHMFNHHVCTVQDWTLDQLIDWVRSVEPAEQPASEPAPREEAQSVPSDIR